MENTICRDYQLAAMDREMNALYRRVTGQKTSQKKWLGRRIFRYFIHLRNKAQTVILRGV